MNASQGDHLTAHRHSVFQGIDVTDDVRIERAPEDLPMVEFVSASGGTVDD